MTFLAFIICALATYRLSLMLSKESGPARIFRRLRNAPPPKSSAREGLSCLHCGSVWWGAMVVPAWALGNEWARHGLTALAASGAAICLHHLFTADWKQ